MHDALSAVKHELHC